MMMSSSSNDDGKKNENCETIEKYGDSARKQENGGNTLDTDNPSLSSANKDGVAKRRALCLYCSRPTPRACICDALPKERIVLKKSRVIVLEHPHERKRKDRSLPLLSLCLDPNSMMTACGRRFGDKVDPIIMQHLRDPKQEFFLLYPGPDAVTLKTALETIRERSSSMVNVVVLDATWKHVREMDRANLKDKHYSNHMIRVVLKPTDLMAETTRPDDFQEGRFAALRKAPSPDHLSTAECISWVVSTIEGNPSLYTTLMKPMDLMVEKRQQQVFDGNNKKRDRGEENGGKRGSKKKKCVVISSLPQSTTTKNSHRAAAEGDGKL